MLNKYTEFLTESRIISLIIEGNLQCSGDFLNKIQSFKDKNLVAKILFDTFSKETYIGDDLKQNFIDLSDKDDTISFLSDKKADNISDDSNPFSVKGRSDVKVGRFAKALLSDKNFISYTGLASSVAKLKDKDFEDFVNLYKAATVKEDHKFELVNGENIRKYYDYNNYAFKERGTLGSSCMKHEECQDYFDIYVKNPKVCSLLVYLNGSGEVLGRALVWKLSKAPGSEYFMDRIYTNNDSDVIKFTNYADEKGWMYRYRQNCDNYDALVFKYKGQNIVGEIQVDLSKSDFDQYPFLDTLCCLNREKKYLSNRAFKGVEFLNGTDGESSECFDCDGSGEESNSCSECEGIGSIECSKCEGDGCKKCDDEGTVDCKSCNGTGDGPCTGCVGDYEFRIKTIEEAPNRWGVSKDQVEKELERLKDERLEKKSKKKKK
jgi:hypothetical protein